MKRGYTIDSNYEISKHHQKMLIYNYECLNQIHILPCVEDSWLLKNHGSELIGIWKIKYKN